jgi:hypothetical protein
MSLLELIKGQSKAEKHCLAKWEDGCRFLRPVRHAVRNTSVRGFSSPICFSAFVFVLTDTLSFSPTDSPSAVPLLTIAFIPNVESKGPKPYEGAALKGRPAPAAFRTPGSIPTPPETVRMPLKPMIAT